MKILLEYLYYIVLYQHFVNDILHSKVDGVFKGIDYNPTFKNNHFIDAAIYPIEGAEVKAFRGANDALGSMFLKFKNRSELNEALNHQDEWLHIKVE